MGKQAVFSIVDPIGGRGQEVTRVDYFRSMLGWSLSPDGHRIALVENRLGNVRVLDLQTKQMQVIHPTPPQEGLQTPTWSPDGKRLFLTVSTKDASMLLEMDPSAHTHLLLKNRGWIGIPIPSPDGKRIAYTYGVGESNVTLLEHF
jgi:Tol biopolymer transport system component